VSHHMDGFRSGVARFNELLAERLGVPLLYLFDGRLPEFGCPLLSFKVSELSVAEKSHFGEMLAAGPWNGEVFLHEFCGLELERRIVREARRVHCGNLEILEQVRDLNVDVDVLWTPGLVI